MGDQNFVETDKGLFLGIIYTTKLCQPIIFCEN
jgi:hypothetical protein